MSSLLHRLDSRPLQLVYLAGPISKNCWRHHIVHGLRELNHKGIDGRKEIALWRKAMWFAEQAGCRSLGTHTGRPRELWHRFIVAFDEEHCRREVLIVEQYGDIRVSDGGRNG
jgi:hypothetical protein